MATRLAPEQISGLDPCKFIGCVLDVGCGVATTAIEIARRYSAQVTAADIAPLMLERAEANVRAAGVAGLVTVTAGDILALPHRPRRQPRE